jgi:hypothetical protein
VNTTQKRYCTQWAAQFFAAGELSRRDYRVALTLGNAAEADLVVRSPDGALFEVDVKGLSGQNFWLIRERDPREGLYFVLVYVPPAGSSPRFFVASSAAVMADVRALMEQDGAKGLTEKPTGTGIRWRMAEKYEDRWDCLPH